MMPDNDLYQYVYQHEKVQAATASDEMVRKIARYTKIFLDPTIPHQLATCDAWCEEEERRTNGTHQWEVAQ